MLDSSVYVNPETTQKPKKLLDRAQEVMRIQRYSLRTEEAYLGWMRRYILFHNKRHPSEMGIPEIEAFLSYLVLQGNVAASTQNQALNALLFLYRKVLGQDLGNKKVDGIRATKKRKLPSVLTKEETRRVIMLMTG